MRVARIHPLRIQRERSWVECGARWISALRIVDPGKEPNVAERLRTAVGILAVERAYMGIDDLRRIQRALELDNLHQLRICRNFSSLCVPYRRVERLMLQVRNQIAGKRLPIG